ncbi:hypothetical protein BH24ACI4_BH24ACI4_34260 [soil metagenome]
MLWLEIAGGIFIAWLVMVFLFTPGINYHLSRRTSVHAEDFLYTNNDELNVAMQDHSVAERLLVDYRRDLDDSREITFDEWRRRPLWEKIAGPFIWILERQQ